MANWLQAALPAPPRRDQLPEPAEPLHTRNLWSLLKDMVGKDVLTMSLPAEMLLPCSELQKQAEELEYSELLDQAAEQPKGSIERLLLVAAFSVSPYSNCLRAQRSFNPVHGETFELVYPEKGFRFLSEHVTRNPPVCALHAEGRRWRLDAENEPHVWFWGASVDLNMNFVLQTTFDDGDQFNYTKVKATIGNIVVGKPTVNHTGTFRVENRGTALAAVMELVKPPLLALSSKRKLHEVRGHLEQNGQRLAAPTIHGRWDKAVHASMPDGSDRLLFSVHEVAEKRWGFSRLLVHCNELTPGLLEKLPPTDSRRRDDIRALEACKADQANAAKAKIEERERVARQQAKKSGRPDIEALPPQWFEPDPSVAAGLLGKARRWRYKEGSYWEAREAGSWSLCRRLFDAP